jgi:hypothetical protein
MTYERHDLRYTEHHDYLLVLCFFLRQKQRLTMILQAYFSGSSLFLSSFFFMTALNKPLFKGIVIHRPGLSNELA